MPTHTSNPRHCSLDDAIHVPRLVHVEIQLSTGEESWTTSALKRSLYECVFLIPKTNTTSRNTRGSILHFFLSGWLICRSCYEGRPSISHNVESVNLPGLLQQLSVHPNALRPQHSEQGKVAKAAEPPPPPPPIYQTEVVLFCSSR